MSYKVVMSNAMADSLRTFPPGQSVGLLDFIRGRLADNPELGSRVSGMPGNYTVNRGLHRIVYTVDHASRCITILAVYSSGR